MLFWIDGMKAGKIIGALLLALGLFSSCRREVRPVAEQEEPVLGLAIEFPGPASVRSEVGPLPASDRENALHSLLVWVFRSDDHTLVSEPLSLSGDDMPIGGGVRRYALPVTRSFVSEKPDVDVFVLANAASIGSSLSVNSDWNALHEAFFGDSNLSPYYGFGLNHPVSTVDPALGLPISGCGLDLPVTGEDHVLTVRTVQLSRAVSRLRFVFCKTPADTEGGQTPDEVAIERITLEGCMIPNKEYVFTTAASGVVIDPDLELLENYRPETFTLSGPSVIAENESPRDLVYANQDAVTYDALINDAVADGRLTDMGYFYFRESDRCLRGSIVYTINGGDPVSREFVMERAGDFARNHTWTVLAYFVSGRNLQLDLQVLPWDYNEFQVDFETSGLEIRDRLSVDVSTAEVVRSKNSQFDYDVRLLPNKAAVCRIQILSPAGGSLMIRPEGHASAFRLSTDRAEIHADVNNGYITFTVDRGDEDESTELKYITLSFFVETVDGRVINANSEAINDKYRFIL